MKREVEGVTGPGAGGPHPPCEAVSAASRTYNTKYTWKSVSNDSLSEDFERHLRHLL